MARHALLVDLNDVAGLLFRQDGVISRRQLITAGGRPHDLERWVRRRDLSRVLPGVFLTHTGRPTWLQRAWAAVLWAAPAALGLTSAVYAAGGRSTRLPHEPVGEEGPIHLLIGPARQLSPPSWIRLHRRESLDTIVLWSKSPPRQRDEESALDLAVTHLTSGSRTAHLNAVGALAEPVQARRTTTARVQAAMDRRGRIASRAWLTGVLADLGSGATSVLEQGYLRRVERPHGLPRAVWQVRHETVSGAVYRDGLLPGRQLVELDGRAFHQGSAQRHEDLERDLDAAALDLGTVRLGWGQIFDWPCRTAGKMGRLLVVRGWSGAPTCCGPGCVTSVTFIRAA